MLGSTETLDIKSIGLMSPYIIHPASYLRISMSEMDQIV